MKEECIVVGVAGLIGGLLIAGGAAAMAVNNDNHSMMRTMGMHTDHSHYEEATHNGMSMSEMTAHLKRKTGDDFDKAFVETMISHHEGGVAMVELIPSRAKHHEIKQLGEAIVVAQTKEIHTMKQWQKEWGYLNNETTQRGH